MSTGQRYSKRQISTHDFWYTWKKSVWLLVIGIPAFLLLIPFPIAGLPKSSVFNIAYTHDQLKFRFISEEVTMVVSLLWAVWGIICGLYLMRFLLIKSDTTIYFSMGITRKALLTNRLIVGSMLIAIPLVLSMGLSLFLNRLALGTYPHMIRNWCYVTCGFFLTSFVSFLVTVLASIFAGTVLESLIYSVGLLLTPTLVCFAINELMKKLYWGNPYGAFTYGGTSQIKDEFLTRFSFLNPLLFFEGEAREHGIFYREMEKALPDNISFGLLLGFAIFSGILIVLSYSFIWRRKAENSGIMGSNRMFSQGMRWISGFFLSSVVFTFLYDFNSKMAYLLGIIALVVTHFIWNKAFQTYKNNRKSYMISLGGQLVVMGSFVFFLCYGMPVMVEHTVKEKEFIKAEVTYVGSPNYITGEATGSSTGSSYYVNSNVICSDKKEIEEIKKIHQLFIKQGKGRLQQNTEIFSNMLLPYDIQFTYEDEAGKEYKWYYDRATLAQLKELLQVEEFTSVIEKLDQVITGDAWETNQEHKNWANESYGTGDIFLTTSLYESVYELNLTPEKREDLLEAIALDVREEGMQRRYYPKERAEYILMFSKNGEYDCTSFSYHLNNTFVYITKEDIHTMSLLKEYELTNLFEEEGVVESITLQRMNPYEGINEMKYPSSMYFMSYLGQSLDEFMIQKDFGKKYTITDEDKIEALMKGMRNTYFMDEGGFFAAVKIKDKEGYRYLFLPESQVPEFVKG